MSIENNRTEIVNGLTRFADARGIPYLPDQPGIVKGPVHQDVLSTLTFNNRTDFSNAIIDSRISPSELIELGMNPGLGIRSLHNQGITGAGVNAAIIDQNLLLDHPEIADHIIEYHDLTTGCEAEGSMHGPAVASILVGNNLGVAPRTKLVYAASPFWESREKDYVDSLLWIIKKNQSLPPNQKIRVVSVSASPSNRKVQAQDLKWAEAVAMAHKEGMLVLDCTPERRIVSPGYLNYNSPDSLDDFTPGFPHQNKNNLQNSHDIFAPVAPRTVAEQYKPGEYGYTYCGTAGLSWAIPYVAGVLCLGWQVAPQLNHDEMLRLLFETAYVKDGNKIINPVAFIEKLEQANK